MSDLDRVQAWAKFNEHLKQAEDVNKFAEIRNVHINLCRLYLDLVEHLSA